MSRIGRLPIDIPSGVDVKVNGADVTVKGPKGTLTQEMTGAISAEVNADTKEITFSRGSDLRVDLSITLYEAVLGGKVRVPTLGGAVELSIPKNTSSGRTFRLKGKGLPKTGGSGDLFITTRIMLPDGHDAELEALMEKWRDDHPYNPRSDLG